MVTQIHEAMWRVEADGSTIGWVFWVPSRQGFHFRAHRIGRKGPGVRVGEYDSLPEAAGALTRR